MIKVISFILLILLLAFPNKYILANGYYDYFGKGLECKKLNGSGEFYEVHLVFFESKVSVERIDIEIIPTIEDYKPYKENKILDSYIRSSEPIHIC